MAAIGCNAPVWVKHGFNIRGEHGRAPCRETKSLQPACPSERLQNLEDMATSCVQRSTRLQEAYSTREARLDEELWAAAWLRAEGYLEDNPYGRYIESQRRKFAEQEFGALKRRLSGRVGQSIKCICFIAVLERGNDVSDLQRHVDPIVDTVIGTLDISCRQVVPGEGPKGPALQVSEMLGLHRYAYISNVCVSKTARRNGVASKLLQAAAQVAKQWGLSEIYVHVLPTNLAAQKLYSKHGFHTVQAPLSEIKAGQPVLLCRNL